MAEKHYTFLIANRVENTLVFAGQNDDLATQICIDSGYEKFIWLDEKETPARWSTYDKKTDTFTAPTPEYLFSIGILNELPQAETPKTTVK